MTALTGRRLWAPIFAALIVGAIYLSRVDSSFYFLWGLESQGILLAKAIAAGQGMVDLSLPGHPAHVREPPLYYFMVSLLIRAFGLRLLPMKVLMWAGCALSAAFAAALLQRRVPPWLAAALAVFAMAAPELFRTATGPKTEPPFTALLLAALLITETVIERAGGPMTGRDRLRACAAGALIAATVMMRSLGLAVLLAALGALLLRRDLLAAGRWRQAWPRLVVALWLCLPTALALGGWAARGAAIDNPAGYSYVDWFLMDLAPDSPEMTAVDFHSPLMDPPRRLSVPAAAWRSLSHLPYYGALFTGLLFGQEAAPLRQWGPGRLFLLLLPVMFLGMWSAERGRPPLLPLFLLVYTVVLLTWPMDDQRLVYPLVPLTGGWLGIGLARLASGVRGGDGPSGLSRRGAIIAAVLLLPAFARDQVANYRYDRQMASLPGIELSPGFTVRFQDPERMRSFRLLLAARDAAAPDAVLMYHSPPPCRLVTGHDCQSIPFTRDLRRVRDYLVGGGADLVVVDGWGRVFPGGPGWLTENILRPTLAAYPDDFEPVAVAGDDGVYRVRRPPSASPASPR